MPDFNQSHLSELRDQLSLDHADGTRLNIVGSNLGLHRPVFGFDDTVWRALVKELALDHKQIANKFRDVLAVLFGPQTTQATVLTENTIVGQTYIHVANSDNFPQCGTLILDEVTAQEEVDYSYIDRYNHIIYLDSPLTTTHTAQNTDAEAVVLGFAPLSGRLLLTTSSGFPTSGYPYPVVLGRGTSNEEVVLVTDNDIISNTLTLFLPPTLTPRPGVRPTPISTTMDTDYVNTSVFLVGDEIRQFPNTGLVKLGPTDNSFTLTGVISTQSVTVAASTFTADSLIGYVVRFSGNTTAALAGQEVTVGSNTATNLTFTGVLPATPAIGDTFTLLPVLEYVSVERDSNALVLRKPLPTELEFVAGTALEYIEAVETVLLSQVKVAGAGWDVIQAQPRLVELLLPESLEDEGRLRTASYLHTVNTGGTVTTTVMSNSSVGDNTISTASTASLPLVGVVTIDPGGPNEERLGYYVANSSEIVFPTQTLAYAHAGGEDIELYQPAHSGTTVLIGDYNQTEDTFPGPYLYNPGEDAPTATVARTTLAAQLPGPSIVAMTQEVNRTALEILDASSWDRVNFPYTVLVGSGTGNREQVTVNDLNFKNRTFTTLANTASIGSTSIELTALSMGAAGDAANFPNSNGYRVIVDKGTASAEVCYVLGTATGPNRLLLEQPTTISHTAGVVVELMADVASVNALTDDHNGVVPFVQRSTALSSASKFPVYSQSTFENAELAQPEIEEFDVADATGMDTDGGTLLLNYGSNQIKWKTATDASESAGSTSVDVGDATGLPASGDFVVTFAPGTFLEEKAIVSSRASNTLTIDFGLRKAHAAGTVVLWEPGIPESLDYDSITGNTVSFSNPVVLQSNHSKLELVLDSSATSTPRANGYDFAFRMPPDSISRLGFILDLIRAAGVQVELITQR